MNLLERYIIEAEDDAKVDEINVQEKSLKLPTIKHKWVARLINAKRDQVQFKRDKKKLQQELAERVKEKSPTSISDNAAYAAAAKHHDIVELQEKIDEYDTIIEYLEKVEKVFSSATWDYRNIVEIMKMETM